MKKLILLLALGLSLGANAQLTVLESGRVHVGSASSEDLAVKADLIISSEAQSTGRPTIATPPSGTVAFGSEGGIYISGGGRLGDLQLRAPSTINLGIGNILNAVYLSALNKEFSSSYDIKAPSFLTTSDIRLKTNVASLHDSLGKLQEVNAVSYTLSQPALSMSDVAPAKKAVDDVEYLDDDRTHFGFIAQEIQEIFPNLVVEGENGMLAIDYTGFIPLLVEAYKDLSVKVKEQEEVIAEMAKLSSPRQMPAAVTGLTDQKAILKQNRPNPFNTTTTIECTVPDNVASAFICVYDLQGKQVHRIDISDRGEVANVIDASCLAPGMYIYTLIADGVEIDSKRMIITD